MGSARRRVDRIASEGRPCPAHREPARAADLRTQHQLLAGTLKAGDHVDVVGNWNGSESKTRHFSRVIQRDILVLRAADGPKATEKLTSPNNSPLSAAPGRTLESLEGDRRP